MRRDIATWKGFFHLAFVDDLASPVLRTNQRRVEIDDGLFGREAEFEPTEIDLDASFINLSRSVPELPQPRLLLREFPPAAGSVDELVDPSISWRKLIQRHCSPFSDIRGHHRSFLNVIGAGVTKRTLPVGASSAAHGAKKKLPSVWASADKAHRAIHHCGVAKDSVVTQP